jgi:hypothetical protein
LHTVSDYSADKGIKTINEAAEWPEELKRYFTYEGVPTFTPLPG